MPDFEISRLAGVWQASDAMFWNHTSDEKFQNQVSDAAFQNIPPDATFCDHEWHFEILPLAKINIYKYFMVARGICRLISKHCT